MELVRSIASQYTNIYFITEFRYFRTEIKGPNFNFDNTWGHRPDDDSLGHGPSSLKCRCVQTPPNCDPEDGFDVVLVCDNTRGMVDVSCTYSHTVGTSYSEEMEEGFSASASVESHMQSDFFGLFRFD